MKLNVTDEEIIKILKEAFGSSKKIIDPDDLLKSLILKGMLLFSFLGVLAVVYYDFTDTKAPESLSGFVAGIVAMFFCTLTLYINAKSQNGSLLVWALSMSSLYLGYYLGGA